jgi:hypothetical protein
MAATSSFICSFGLDIGFHHVLVGGAALLNRFESVAEQSFGPCFQISLSRSFQSTETLFVEVCQFSEDWKRFILFFCSNSAR